MSSPEVNGYVAPGLEAVADSFARADLGRGGAAFAVYVDGEKVIDVWGGVARPGVLWVEDTTTTMMSATKGCAALCAHVLHDRALLDVDAPVAEYWPEFAQAGKERTLVRHILNHTAGVLGFDDPGSVLDWEGNGWDDYAEIAKRLAASAPSWEPGTKIAYHAITVGWLLQELVRRITGKTLGTFFAEEIAAPLGLTISIGTPPEEQVRLADAMPAPPPPPEVIDALGDALKAALTDPTSLGARSGIYMHGGAVTEHFEFFNLPAVRAIEIPAANGSGDARSLARMYAVLAQGGELDGVRLVSPESIELFGTMTFSGVSEGLPVDLLPKGFPLPVNRYALGYEGDFGDAPKPWRFGPTPEAFGHLGAGGQIGFADPVRRVSVGFLRNDLTDWAVPIDLVDALYKSL